MRTSDPAILAIGDCTCFPAHALAQHAGGRLRLESVQNANDQARTATATLTGTRRALPRTALVLVRTGADAAADGRLDA